MTVITQIIFFILGVIVGRWSAKVQHLLPKWVWKLLGIEDVSRDTKEGK